MNIIAIIPSRYSSSRLPGKPLAIIGNKPMVQWVYENCKKGLDHVFVATDDQRIIDAVEEFGGKAVMTSENHSSGTDRCAEAAVNIEKKYGIKADVVINVQGDEPFFESAQIDDIKACFDNPDTQIATLVQEAKDLDQVLSQSEVKVVLNNWGEGVYFSRSPIPFLHNIAQKDWMTHHTFYRHLGIYAYRTDILKEIVKLNRSSLEIAESLEQLRWIENGFPVSCVITELDETMCIDTKEDLKKANEMVKGK
ncbi:3-deoxy-manno-octulosonate cytidylyltransferase (CMP-KDO synthetase) [Saccharicrinis carchari]|uniref:3-deoxy-manno-octulosonate cytidylyltransferase n=1 Tax=Saccharicrinis carchari TaxID=1168039 RepID=A0A521DF64_SACCC|nr:3-deoxy-manno-octulosonate cytidylyltransferase [Saccharicrinis carchari]SMO70215.1 3-deoxy-manno-octulosonate cytidylyltransferase (CMP-KDO synthetase) [Saccharicrinis carchari]